MKMKISILNTFLPGPSVMISDGYTIDFPIRLHSKLKWSSFIKQDDGTVMPKARSFEEVLVVNLVKKRC